MLLDRPTEEKDSLGIFSVYVKEHGKLHLPTRNESNLKANQSLRWASSPYYTHSQTMSPALELYSEGYILVFLLAQ